MKVDGVLPASPYHVISPLGLEVKMSLNRMGVPSSGAPRMSADVTVLGISTHISLSEK